MNRHILCVTAILFAGVVCADSAEAYYHSGLGRWLNRDPGSTASMSAPRKGIAQSLSQVKFVPLDQYRDGPNLYQHVQDNPQSKRDPSGLWIYSGLIDYSGDDHGTIGMPIGCQQGGSRPIPPPIPPIPPTPDTPPGPGWEWRPTGSTPGCPNGGWFNPGTGESLHPDLDHAPPKPPHWDWVDPWGNQWEYYPDTGVWLPKPGNR